MKRHARGVRGFTLIELLVIVAIIAILAAIVFPVFLTAKKNAKRAQCQSNMRQVVAALLRYSDDNSGATPSPCFYFTSWGDGCGWTERVSPYMQGRAKGEPTRREAKVYVCPEQQFNYSYGLVWCYVGRRNDDRGLTMSVIQSPTKMILVYHLRPYYSGDENSVSAWASVMHDSGLSNDSQADGEVYYRHPVNGTSKNMRAYYLAWPGVHVGGNSLAFADGHVGWFFDWSPGRMTFLPYPRYQPQ